MRAFLHSDIRFGTFGEHDVDFNHLLHIVNLRRCASVRVCKSESRQLQPNTSTNSPLP